LTNHHKNLVKNTEVDLNRLKIQNSNLVESLIKQVSPLL